MTLIEFTDLHLIIFSRNKLFIHRYIFHSLKDLKKLVIFQYSKFYFLLIKLFYYLIDHSFNLNHYILYFCQKLFKLRGFKG
jgi:hypothetical protein